MRSIYYRKYSPYRDSEILSKVGVNTQYLRNDKRQFWEEKECNESKRYAQKKYNAEQIMQVRRFPHLMHQRASSMNDSFSESKEAVRDSRRMSPARVQALERMVKATRNSDMRERTVIKEDFESIGGAAFVPVNSSEGKTQILGDRVAHSRDYYENPKLAELQRYQMSKSMRMTEDFIPSHKSGTPFFLMQTDYINNKNKYDTFLRVDGSTKKRTKILSNFRTINKSVNNAYLRIKEAQKEGIDDKNVSRTAQKMGKLMTTILNARPQSVQPPYTQKNSYIQPSRMAILDEPSFHR